jgi:hypothetical protein
VRLFFIGVRVSAFANTATADRQGSGKTLSQKVATSLLEGRALSRPATSQRLESRLQAEAKMHGR